MKILVCISHVPDTTTVIKFSGDQLDKNGVSFIIGPYDDFALARAVELKEQLGASVTVINVGTAETEPTIRKALALGVDGAVRVDAEPVDSVFVATQIAEHAKSVGYDMILMGRETSDFNGGLVHGLVAEMLGWPCIAPCMKLDINGSVATLAREIEGGKEYLEVALPFVAGCQEPIAEWKIPNMRGIMSARTKPLTVVPAIEVPQITHHQNFELPASKGQVKMIDPANLDELVKLLKEEAKVI
jgi:electron transfer flavoprotein beta subunit